MTITCVCVKWGWKADRSRWCDYIENRDGHFRGQDCVFLEHKKEDSELQFYLKVRRIKL